jgi:HlyD family secretion protein
MKKISIIILSLSLGFIACKDKNNHGDAYGNFESTDQVVSSEVSGKLLNFDINEGMILQAGETIGLIDTVQLYLQKNQILASIQAIRSKQLNIEPQLTLIQKQIDVVLKEKRRVQELIREEAATQKQLDDIQGQLDILQQQIETQKDQNKIANNSILGQIPPLRAQLAQIDDLIRRSNIVNPIKGTVLIKLADQGNMVSPARPLYKIANLDKMELRAYVSGDQLSQISIGQEVQVQIDNDDQTNESLTGTISWIADRAEFTPKTIQTKEERVNLVYAFKVTMDNPEGKLKIGMPGEVHFPKNTIKE